MNSSYQTYLYSSILDSKSDILCTTSKPSYYNLKPFTMPPFNNNSIPTNINGYPQTSFYNMCQYFDNLLSNLNESNDGADIKLNIANTTNNYVLNSHNSEINLYKPLSTDLLKKDKHSNIKYLYGKLVEHYNISIYFSSHRIIMHIPRLSQIIR
ncbi:hypothetical protein BDF14DRAFT_834451 [Spinellus fusiger]|nr:hypothetical protein BDF14DRAFT_834451 [Spinellus fusiger]